MGEAKNKEQAKGRAGKMIIAIDFDGVCVSNEYPQVGLDIGAVPVLLDLVAKGHKLVLLTNRDGQGLTDAENWFRAYGVPLYAINRNPLQWKFSKSPKVYADMYIDDRALGCPLKKDKSISRKPFVDWEKVRFLLRKDRKL